MKPKLAADLISDMYSKLDKDSVYAAIVIGKMIEAGLDPDLLLDAHDDIISDANEWRESCPLCGEKLGSNALCERCNQDASDSVIERKIDEAVGK